MARPFSRLRYSLVPVLLAGAILMLVPGLGGIAQANVNPCTKWGDAKPGTIRTHQAERAIMCLINRKRHEYGKQHLGFNKKLEEAAGRHSSYMLNTGCFAHQCSGEGSVETRLRSVGYLVGGLLRWVYGENIAWGERYLGTPQAIVKAWMHSPEHRANILNGTFSDAGVGVKWGTPGNKNARGGIYTQDFGYRLLG